MTKRVLAFLMVMAMVLSLVPTVVMTAAAEAVPGYSLIIQKAHNQTEGSLTVDVYLQANTADQAAVTGYNFTVTPAEGLALSGVADATGNDNLKANGETNVVLYDPTAAKPITVGTSKVLVATLTVTGETLPAQVKDAITLSDVVVTEAEASYDAVVVAASYACTDHACGHGEGEWKAVGKADVSGVSLESGNYYLTEDVLQSNAIKFAKDATVNFCLNGYDIEAAAAQKVFLIAPTGVTLTICDCTGSGEGVNYTSGRIIPCHTWGGAIDVGKDCGATIYMYGGTIDGTATDSAAANGAGNGIFLRSGNNKITAKGVKFVGLEGYTNANGNNYGPNILRGTGTSGVFENCTFVDCGGAIIDANSGSGEVKFAPTLVVKDCVVTDSQEGARAIEVKHNQFASVSIEGNCQFDVPVYVANGEKPVSLNLGSEAEVSILTQSELTEEAFGEAFVIPEGGSVTAGTVLYENAGGYVTYKDGKFAFSSHAHDDIAFKVWNDPTSLPAEGNWYLDTDVTLAIDAPAGKNAEDYSCVTIESGDVLNLDLNGHTITAAGNMRIFGLEGGTLNLFDCAEEYDAEGNWTGGQITGSPSKYGAIRLYRGLKNGPASTFNMYGGRLTGNGSTASGSNGGAMYIYCDRTETDDTGAVTALYKGGVFNMYGGEICNNRASWGGAVISTWGNDFSKTKESSATINIYDGKIYGNVTSGLDADGDPQGQGNIYLTSNAVLNIYDGTFEDNSVATLGGFVAVNGSATLNIEGGKFIGNAAGTASENFGGAIYLGSKNNTVTIKNATFDGNTASKTAGAIYVYASCTPTIENCIFTNNVSTSSTGGAFAATSSSNTLIKDCVFTGNDSKGSAGGAIYIAGSAVITLDNCTITGNNAKGSGAGVYVTNTSNHVTLKGNTVIDNNKRGGTVSDYANLYFQKKTDRTDAIYVDELGTDARIVAYLEVPGFPADSLVKLAKNGTQTQWEPGAIQFSDSKVWQNVSYVDTDADGVKEFIYGHYHIDASGDPVEYKAWTNAEALPTADELAELKGDGDIARFYLTTDVAYATYSVPGDFDFCLNGHTIKTTGRTIVFDQATPYSVTMDDCTAAYGANDEYIAGGLTSTTNGSYGSGIRFTKKGNFTMNAGKLFGFKYSGTSAPGGAAIYIHADASGSTFNMNGGEICDINMASTKAKATYCGVVQCQGNSTTKINLQGGRFRNITYKVNPAITITDVAATDTVVAHQTYSGGSSLCGSLYYGNGALDVDNVIVQDITVDVAAGSNVYPGFYRSGGSMALDNVTYRNCTVTTGEALTYKKLNSAKTGTTVTNIAGVAYGAAQYLKDTMTITGCVFEDNQSIAHATTATYGGGALNIGGGTVTVKDCEFYRNHAGSVDNKYTNFGGALFNSSHVVINGGIFEGNSAVEYGGALFNYSTSNSMTITGTADKPVIIRDNVVLPRVTADGSKTGGYGGGIDVMNGVLTASYVLFENNHAEIRGGAFRAGGGGGTKWETTLDHCTFVGNTSKYGGAIEQNKGTLDITNSTFDGNEANVSGGTGGAISMVAAGSNNNKNVVATIDNCEFINNSSVGLSGAINSEKATTLTVTNSDFIDNYGAEGGVTRTKNAATNVTYEKCNFIRNTSNSSGGALSLNYIGKAIIKDCVFDGNTAKTNGGAIRVDGSSSTTVWDISGCTFKNNTARNGGAIMAEPDNDAETNLKLTNCTIEGNTAVDASAIYLSGNTFAMVVTLDGTTITGNTSENRAAIYASGSEALKLVLKGATVVDGNTCAYEPQGSELFLVHKTLDPVEGSTERIISNVTIDASGLTEGAKIGLAVSETRLTEDPVVSINGGAAQKAYFYCAVPEYMVLDTKTVGESEELCFYRYIDEDGKYATMQDYIDAQVAAGAEKVTLPVNAAEEVAIADDLKIDLNGKTLTKITVAENKTLQLIDSATNGYSSENASSVAVEGNVAPYAEDTTNGLKRYVTFVDENGNASAHRIYLAINSKVLRTANNGVGFKAIFAGDDVVAANQDAFGIEIALTPEFTAISKGEFAELTAGIEGTTTPNQKTAILRDVLYEGGENQKNAETTIYGRPYFVIGDQVVYGATVSTTLKDLAANALNSSDATVVAAVQQMLDTFGVTVK